MADTRNTIKFLVATDNHLGAYEKTPVRRDDSFVTFEEILEKAVEHKVDFVLLAGDLFDENKPSHRTLHRTMELLRRYCMGNKRIDIELVSDPALSMSNGVFGVANFQDPNLNISIPVFCIHGNHDDPVGEHALSALDLLSVSGLVNYFGKSPSNDNIVLHPLLFTKGTTKLGLYGLGHIREERLHRCFVHKKVKFMRPSEDTQDWFNCMAIHQNRNVKGVAKKNGVKEEMLKGFLDLVIWGHEHEQLLAATPAVGAEYDIIQPGSSIMATPNSEELNPKKIAVVEVHGTAYRVTPVTLKSTRPVEFCTVVLQEEEGLQKSAEDVSEYLSEKVEEMIVRAQEKVSKIPDAVLQRNRDLKIPIVRIRVDYSPDFPTVNPVTFGSKFIHRVANPHHLLIAQKTPKKRTPAASSGMQSDLIDGEEDSTPGAMATAPGSMADKIAREVHGYIRQKKHLGLLSEHHLTDATLSFIEKAETNAINTFVDAYVQRAQRGIWKDVRSRVDVTPDLVKKLANGIRQSVENDWQKANQSVAAPGVSRREESQAGKSSASSLFKRDSMIKEEELDDFAVPPPDAGQRGPAVDTQGTSSKIKLEDMDEDPDDMPAPPASALAPQRANATPDEISEQSNSLDVDALQPLPAVKKAARKKPAAKRAKASPKATTRRKRTAAEVDDSASEDEPAKKKKPAAKKASPKVSKGPQQLSLTSTAAVMANWGKKKKQ